jgi:thiamine biosynthesis lipoprotein
MIEPQPDSQKGQRASPLHRFEHDAMACTFGVLLVEEDVSYAEQAAHAAFAEVDRLERELSRFVETSDIARINLLEPGQHVRVGIEAVECLQLAARLYDETGGAFDITYGSCISEDTPRTGPPLELEPTERFIAIRFEGVQVDLGGVGKGYAVDQMAAVLREWSIAAGVIHCGQSSALALGRPAGGGAWTVAIRDPEQRDRVLGSVPIADCALSGSGRLLHGNHIIDTRSGRAPAGKLGAWASAPSAAVSDALSTAFMVMASDEIADYCQAHADVGGLICYDVAGKQRVESFGVLRDLWGS